MRASNLPVAATRGRTPATSTAPDAAHAVAAKAMAAGARHATVGTNEDEAQETEDTNQEKIDRINQELAALYLQVVVAKGDMEQKAIRRKSGSGMGGEEEEKAAQAMEANTMSVADALQELRASQGGPKVAELAGNTAEEGGGHAVSGAAPEASTVKVRTTYLYALMKRVPEAFRRFPCASGTPTARSKPLSRSAVATSGIQTRIIFRKSQNCASNQTRHVQLAVVDHVGRATSFTNCRNIVITEVNEDLIRHSLVHSGDLGEGNGAPRLLPATFSTKCRKTLITEAAGRLIDSLLFSQATGEEGTEPAPPVKAPADMSKLAEELRRCTAELVRMRTYTETAVAVSSNSA